MILAALLTVVAIYVLAVVALAMAGRRTQARAVAGFIPDCVVLLRRLIADPAVPRTDKALMAATVGYLLMPIDLIPDFLPVVGQLDDAIVVALVLRRVLRRSGPARLAEHWPGPEESLRVVVRLVGG